MDVARERSVSQSEEVLVLKRDSRSREFLRSRTARSMGEMVLLRAFLGLENMSPIVSILKVVLSF